MVATNLKPTTFSKDVTAAGTAEALGTSARVEEIWITANITNTGNIYLGDSAVDKSTNKGSVLVPGQTAVIKGPTDIGQHYIDVDISGEGVTGNYWKA